MTERASIFSEEETSDLDVAGFAPKKPEAKLKSAPREVVRAVSESANFPSREVPPAPQVQAVTPIRESRRHRTGRNVQMNVKLKQETVDTFYEITDSQGWVLGETLEQALLALKEKLAS